MLQPDEDLSVLSPLLRGEEIDVDGESGVEAAADLDPGVDGRPGVEVKGHSGEEENRGEIGLLHHRPISKTERELRHTFKCDKSEI